jgi:mRNA interferase MazF
VPSTREPRIGEVWDIDFSPQVGREQAGIRPALVISNDHFNDLRTGLYIVAPISGTNRGLPYQINVEPPEGGLTKRSVIMCDQEKSQSVQRFLHRRGKVSEQTLRLVQQIVGTLIDR